MKLSTACCRLALFLSLWCLAFYQGLLSYEWFETGVMTLGEEEDWRRQPLKKPNILFILADDLGYDDVPWHNPYIFAPTLKRLSEEGVILESHYAQSVCSPSRTALLTGYYPIRTGMQHDAIAMETNGHLPLNIKLLPQYLNRHGYFSYMVGKWHLGHCHRRLLPISRGFDKFNGYLGNGGDHYGHCMPGVCYKVQVETGEFCAFDFRDGERTDLSANQTYSSELLSWHAKNMLESHMHDKPGGTPFFLYLSLKSIHDPFQAPERHYDWHRQYAKLANRTLENRENERVSVLAMITAMDVAITETLDSLKRLGFMEDTIVVFASDNGPTSGSAFPLRGKKRSMWEGGHRVPTIVYAPKLLGRRGTWNGYLKQLCKAAGMPGGWDDGLDLDGVSMWNELRSDLPSRREEMLYNINEIHSSTRQVNAGIRLRDMKLIRGSPAVGNHIAGEPPFERLAVAGERSKIFEQGDPLSFASNHSELMLFNITADPGEYQNLADQMPGVVKDLLIRLERHEHRMQNHSWPWQTQCQAGKRLDVMRLGWCKWIDGEYYDEEEE